jgi:subtilisin family serine protease
LLGRGFGVAVGQVPAEPDPVPAEVPPRFSGEYPSHFETGVVLVTFRSDVSVTDRIALLEQVSVRAVELVTPGLPDLTVVRLADGTEEAAVHRLRSDPRVRVARKNWARYPTHAHSISIKQICGGQQTPYNVAQSNGPLLWQIPESGEADGGVRGGGVALCVIDSGYAAHTDLLIPALSINFITLGAPVVDVTGHGAAVAGFALARDNGVCIVGAAPSARLVVAKAVPDVGVSTLSNSIKALEWARTATLTGSEGDNQMAVRVVNCSYAHRGLQAADEDEEIAVNRALAAGVVVVSTAGNCNSCEAIGADPSPAAYAGMLSVGSVDSSGVRATNEVDSCPRPSVDLVDGGHGVPGLGGLDGCDTVWAGTSFAAPVVAGVAALLFDYAEVDSTKARDPRVGFLVRQALILGATDVVGGFCNEPVGRDAGTGRGLVNAMGAVGFLQAALDAPPDHDRSRILDGDDLADFIADYLAASPVPGPAGYAVPVVITMLNPGDAKPPAPLDELGYKSDFDQNGVLNPHDLADYISAYWTGCR